MKSRKCRVITLCGSTKFQFEFLSVAQKLTLKGNVVLYPAFFSQSDNIQISDKQKEVLDKVHLKKIDLADEIIVINKYGYIGKSTNKEIEYAKKHNKKVNYLYDYQERKGWILNNI